MKGRFKRSLAAAVASAAMLGACGNELAKADELMATGDPEGAAAIYRAWLEKKPGDGAGTIGLARALHTVALEKAKKGEDSAEDWEEAAKAMEEAVLVDPAPEGMTVVPPDMLAECLYRAGMKHAETTGLGAAVPFLEKAADKGKKAADLYMTLARASANAGDRKSALKHAYRAAKIDKRQAEFFREAAGWAKSEELPWVHHHYFYLAEQVAPLGFEFKMPGEIQKGLAKRYPAFNLVNDTLGLFLATEEVEARTWEGMKERETMIADMDKFIEKSPPAAFEAADRPRLPWVVYHYYNTTGVVLAYLGSDSRAKSWFEKAVKVAKTGKVSHPDVPKPDLEVELSWAEKNLELIK